MRQQALREVFIGIVDCSQKISGNNFQNTMIIFIFAIDFNQFVEFDIIENIKLFYCVLSEVVDFIQFWVLLLELHYPINYFE